MLPLWQFRPCGNFVQVQRCLVQFLQINRTLGGCVSKESAFESWSSRCEMDPCPGNGHSSAVSHQAQKLQVPIHINRKAFTLELDTAAGGNFISPRVWTELGKLKLQQAQWHYHSASTHPLPIITRVFCGRCLCFHAEETTSSFSACRWMYTSLPIAQHPHLKRCHFFSWKICRTSTHGNHFWPACLSTSNT